MNNRAFIIIITTVFRVIYTDWNEFEGFARKIMSQYFSANLTERNLSGFPKRFDMVSPDESIVGDAKYLTLVHKKTYPPPN